MEPIEGFCDLCISETKNIKELKDMLKELVQLGYRNVAIEQVYDDTTTDTKAKKTDPIPEPLKLNLEEFEGKLRVFNRLTIVYSDNAINLVTNKSKNLKSYHIVAALPTTESAFQFACQSFGCDLISYNEDTMKLRFSRAHYLQAVSRNVFFEIKYAPSIVDTTERRMTILKAHKYRDLGKAKNIVVSSGALTKFQLRGPYDVANLGWIFGLTEPQSKEAIRGHSRLALIHGETRRHGSSQVYVKKLAKLGVFESDEYSESDKEEEEESADETEEPLSKKQKVV